MVTFKKYVLLNEVFQVPYSIMQPILDYYYESYKKLYETGRTKITTKLFPEKNFKLDFTGTRFEFLNKMQPSVNIYFTKGNYDYCGLFSEWDKNRVNTMDRSNTGNITINFACKFHDMYYGTIEHEVLHYIQDLIKKYRKLKGEKDGNYGGLPSKKLIPAGMETHGRKKRRRTHHEYRPIEYYTNLISAIRSIELTYEREMRKDPPTYEKYITDKEHKKEFLNHILKSVRSGIVGSSEHSRILSKVRGFSKELYQKYLQIIYKVFVEGEPAFNIPEIKKMMEELQQVRERGSQAKRENALEQIKKEAAKEINFEPWARDNLLIKHYDTFDIFDKSPVPIDDGRSISGEEILENIGLKRKEYTKDEVYDYYLLPKKPSSIAKLFKNLKELKKKPWTYELRINDKNDRGRDPTQEEMIKIYDGIYKELKDRYLYAVTDSSKEPLSNLIDKAYL
jgi:hypothetical protein